MEKRNEFPFPQADDFDKVVTILNVDDEKKLKDRRILAMLLGDVTERQVQYYLSACQYLGLVSAEKTFTDLGDKIRSLGDNQQFVELARIIISNEIFGTIYFSEKSLGSKFSKEDIVEIMHDHKLGFESNNMYERRAQTVLKWIEWINSKFDAD